MEQFDFVSLEDRAIADEFLKNISVQFKQGTCNTYKASLGLFYLCLEDQEISFAKKARRKHIVYWLSQLKLRRYAESTKLQHVFHVRLYLTWLYEMGHSRKDPRKLIVPQDLPKLPRKFPRPIPADVDKKLVEYLTNSNDPLDKCLLMLRYTGLRINDLVKLDYQPVHSDDDGNKYIRAYANKLDKEYIIPIDHITAEVISTLQEHAREYSTDVDSQGFPVRLLNDPKGRMIAPIIRQHLTSIAHLVSDKPFTPHQLRHTYATSLVNAGMGLFSVMKLLGHVDIRMTLRYAELYPARLHSEYQSAIKNVMDQYEISSGVPGSSFNPEKSLEDLVAWLRNKYDSRDKNVLRLLKRASKLKTDLASL